MWTTTQRPVPVPAQADAGTVVSAPTAARPLPPGAVRWSLRTEVLVDGSYRQVPVAVDEHGREVVERPAKVAWLARALPWGSIRHRMRYAVRPFLVAGGVAGLAGMLHANHTPAVVAAGLALTAAGAAYRAAPRVLIRGGTRARAEVDIAEREGRPRRPRLADLSGRDAEKVGRRQRLTTYVTGAAGAWLTAADAAGLDPNTLGGRLSWTALAVVAPVAAWPYIRYYRPRPEPEPEAQPDPATPEFGQLIAARWAETVGAVARPERKVVTVPGAAPDVAPAVPGGKLPGTVLIEVRRVAGGWAAWIVDPHARGLDFTEGKVRSQIAAVFGAGVSAVTLEPDADDAARCHIMVQKHSPLREPVGWDGPDSIDPAKGTGMLGRFAEGGTVLYEVYRPGWGCPHDALFGTTGSGKSATFLTLMAIDRWMHYRDDAGVPHGMVADLLLDPQHGQSFGPFLDDLAGPVATSEDEARMLIDALEREAFRRNAYLATVPWIDGKGRPRKGREWWNPLIDGPILVFNIDEAHFFLGMRWFAPRLTAAARMWRKCGMKIRLGTHTPLLQDLGGSTALRDMLLGGFVWVGRTANSLSGPIAFNGQLPVDPKSIPKVPGLAYALAGENPRAMLMRSAREPDWYDWVRDEHNEPIGYPAALPPETLEAMGRDFVQWRGSGLLAPTTAAAKPSGDDPAEVQGAEDAVVEVLLAADTPLGMDELDAALRPYRDRGVKCSLRTARAAIRKLREAGKVAEGHGNYELAPGFRERLLAARAEEGKGS